MPSPLPRSFNGLAWSNLAAQSAEQLSLAATPIVAVLALGAGPGEVGLLRTAQALPFLLLSIPLGLRADRASRLRLLVWAETLRLVHHGQHAVAALRAARGVGVFSVRCRSDSDRSLSAPPLKSARGSKWQAHWH